LLKHGLAVFDELRQSVEEIEYLADPTKGELRIATHEVMAAGFLPAVVKSLHRRHPDLIIGVKLSVVADTLYRELRDRNVDLILDAPSFNSESLAASIPGSLAGAWVRPTHRNHQS